MQQHIAPTHTHIAQDSGSGLNAGEVRRRHILVKALVIGLVAGGLGCAFRWALTSAEAGRRSALLHLRESAGWPAGLAVAIAIGAGGAALGLWLVRRFAPETAGSGIPHLKAVMRDEAPMRWQRVIPVKFFAGLAAIGGGLALGREGPTIQMGGAAGLMVSRWFRVRGGEGERKALMSAGAAAGLSAAFNAPLAGMIFALEELHGHFAPVMFVAAFIASVVANVVCRLFLGEAPVLAMHGMPAPTLALLPPALALGVVCGLAGVVFNKTLLWSLACFDKLRRWPAPATGALAGAVAGAAGWMWPGLGGSGAPLLERALDGGLAVPGVLAALVLARFALTMWSFGSGAAGGIFAPILVLGALGGLALGQAAHNAWPALAAPPVVLAAIGMGGLLTAIVRAPLTGIVLMVELTGRYDFMLPLLACALVAYGIAEGLGNEPIYDSLRKRAAQNASAKSTGMDSPTS
jgi:CIC family chloride channel protein